MKHLGKKATIVLTLLIFAGASVTALELTNTTHWFHRTKSSISNDGINYGPPTATERQDADSHKDNIPSNSQGKSPSTSHTSPKKTVTAVITNFNQDNTNKIFTVNGYVSGVVESGGTCTLTMTLLGNTSQKISVSRQSEANATNTTCGEMSVPLSKLHAGTWNTVLSYSSTTATGISDTNPLEVQ